MPRSRDLMIFVLTISIIDGQTDCLHAQGQNYSPRWNLIIAFAPPFACGGGGTWVNTLLVTPLGSVSQILNSAILVTPTKVGLVAYVHVHVVTTSFSHQLQDDHTSFKTCGHVSESSFVGLK